MRALWLAVKAAYDSPDCFPSACTSSHGSMAPRHDAQRSWTVRDGTVVQVVEATIEGQSGVIGTYGGGYVGHEVGRTIGSGSGSGIAGAVGAVAGAIAGRQAGEGRHAEEGAGSCWSEMGGSGETLAIIQPADQNFDEGEKVRVYTRSDGSARVAKL